jgi:small-conductance mechanosensitive channel
LVARVAAALLYAVLVLALGTALRSAVASRITDVDLRYRARKILGMGTWVLAGLLAVTQFSDSLAGMAAALGVAGAGIAFALQEVIASAAGWLAIQFGGFFRVGDRVQLGGIKGDVIDIGVLRTTLMEVGQWVDGDLYNGRVVRVANSFVFKEPVFNYSAGFPFVWDEIKIPVKYGCDAPFARETLAAIAHDVTGAWTAEAGTRWAEMVKDFRLEDARLDPMVTMVLNDNWMEFTVRYVTHYHRRRFTKDALFQKILIAFDSSPKRLAFASATFHLVEAPAIRIVSEAKENKE